MGRATVLTFEGGCELIHRKLLEPWLAHIIHTVCVLCHCLLFKLNHSFLSHTQHPRFTSSAPSSVALLDCGHFELTPRPVTFLHFIPAAPSGWASPPHPALCWNATGFPKPSSEAFSFQGLGLLLSCVSPSFLTCVIAFPEPPAFMWELYRLLPSLKLDCQLPEDLIHLRVPRST